MCSQLKISKTELMDPRCKFLVLPQRSGLTGRDYWTGFRDYKRH